MNPASPATNGRVMPAIARIAIAWMNHFGERGLSSIIQCLLGFFICTDPYLAITYTKTSRTDPQVFIEPIFVAESVGVSSEINNAKAETVRNSNGQVSEIRYSNAGAGYTFTPEITFTLPTSDTFGDY